MSTRPADPPYPNPAYAWYVVGVLLLAYIFSFIDRQIISLLVTPIKKDLQISDTMIGLLGGPAFGIFYAFMGIPIGRLADSRSRRGIIMLGITVWSFATAACGIAKGYWMLFAARIGVGAGEAALSPPAYSLISDYFRPNKLGLALGVYGMGIYIGSGLAFIIGGFVTEIVADAPNLTLPIVGEVFAWQLTFFAVGLPGLLIVLLMKTVKEPVRRGLIPNAKSASVPLSELYEFVKGRRAAFATHFFGFAPISLIGYGSALWIPTYFERTFDGFKVALPYGLIVLIFGPIGIVAGGWLADRWREQGISHSYIRVGAMAALVLLPVNVFLPLMPTKELAIIMLAPSAFFGAMPFGVAPAGIQAITPNRMRAQVSALYLLTVNLIGLGLGPVIIGASTDYIFKDESQLMYTLSLVGGITGIWAVIVLRMGFKPFGRAFDEAQLREASS